MENSELKARLVRKMDDFTSKIGPKIIEAENALKIESPDTE